MKKKTAWYIEPSLLDLLKRRDETLASWLATHNVTDEASMRTACSKMGVAAPAWELVRPELPQPEPAPSRIEAPAERSVPVVMNAWNASRKKKKKEELEASSASPEEPSDADS